MSTPNTRAELVDLIRSGLTDPLNRQNTAALLRVVLEALVDSAYNRAEESFNPSAPPGAASFGTLSGLPEDSSPLANRLATLRAFGVPNTRVDYHKGVRFLTDAEAAADPSGGSSLQSLAKNKIPLFCVVTVEFYRPPGQSSAYQQQLVAVYDDLSTPRAAGDFTRFTGVRDGAGADPLPLKLVPLDSEAAATANIRTIPVSPPTQPFVRGEIGLYALAGVEGFYQYKAPTGGSYAPPTGPDDANWRQVAPPRPQGSFTQSLTVPVAQALAQADTSIDAGVVYRILRGADTTGRRGDVVVQGLAQSPATNANEGDAPGQFAPVGLWLNPQTLRWEQVHYDVTTDTVTPLGDGRYVRVIGNAANQNLILGDPADGNTIGGGPAPTANNLILGGSGNAIVDGYQNSIHSSTGCTVQGGYNQVVGGNGCVVPGTCQHVILINCTSSLVIPAGTTHQTYIDDQPVGGGEPLDIYARNSQAEADRIALLFTAIGQAFAFDPVLTAPYPFASVVANFATGDVYTLVPNYNDIDASGNAKPYWSRPA